MDRKTDFNQWATNFIMEAVGKGRAALKAKRYGRALAYLTQATFREGMNYDNMTTAQRKRTNKATTALELDLAERF